MWAFRAIPVAAIALYFIRITLYLGNPEAEASSIDPASRENVEIYTETEEGQPPQEEYVPSPTPRLPETTPFKPWVAGEWGPEDVGVEPEYWQDWPLTGGRDEPLFLAQNDKSVRSVNYSGSWKTPVVVVPATYNEFIGITPGFMLELLTSPKRSLYLYQRFEKELGHYAHNIGFESGIYLRFIVDHYDDLPEVMVGVHGGPEAHNLAWRQWVGCLRPNMTYTSLNTEWVEDRVIEAEAPSPVFSPYQLWTEQCMRDVLDLIGAPIKPRQPLPFHTYCCAQFAVHRDVIRRRPKAVWEKLYAMFGAPPGLCHTGPPRDLSELVSSSPEVVAENHPWGPEYDDGDQHGKIVLGLTMEHLSGTVFGGEPWDMPQPYGQGHFCAQFFPASVCPGSPCEG